MQGSRLVLCSLVPFVPPRCRLPSAAGCLTGFAVRTTSDSLELHMCGTGRHQEAHSRTATFAYQCLVARRVQGAYKHEGTRCICSSLVAKNCRQRVGARQAGYQKHTVQSVTCRIILAHNLAVYFQAMKDRSRSISTSAPVWHSCPRCT